MRLLQSKVVYEKNEKDVILKSLEKLNKKYENNPSYIPFSLNDFESYLVEYARLRADKGVKDIEKAFKYASMCLYMELSSNYMISHKINIFKALDSVTKNDESNVYKDFYLSAVELGSECYYAASERDVSSDFAVFRKGDLKGRAIRNSIFDNHNRVCEVYSSPNEEYHSKNSHYKSIFVNDVCEDIRNDIDKLDNKGLSRKEELKGLYNIALKFRTLKECQREWWWPFRLFKISFWTNFFKLNSLEDKLKTARISVLSDENKKKDFIKYMNKERELPFLKNLDCMFFSDFNVAKISNVVYQNIVDDIEKAEASKSSFEQAKGALSNKLEEDLNKSAISLDDNVIRSEKFNEFNDEESAKESELDESKRSIVVDELESKDQNVDSSSVSEEEVSVSSEKSK